MNLNPTPMRIVLGYRSFRLKTFSPAQLEIPNPEKSGIYFELRQMYAHLFYIPFFSLGQKWVIYKDGRMYEVPLSIQKHIDQRAISARTPWWTFIGVIIVVVGLFGYGVQQRADFFRVYRASPVVNVRQAQSDAMQAIESLATVRKYDCYWLKNRYEHSTNVLLEVQSVKGDSMTCSMIMNYIPEDSLTPEKISQLFAAEGKKAEKITVSKIVMKEAISNKCKMSDQGTDVLDDGRWYVFFRKMHLDRKA